MPTIRRGTTMIGTNEKRPIALAGARSGGNAERQHSRRLQPEIKSRLDLVRHFGYPLSILNDPRVCHPCRREVPA